MLARYEAVIGLEVHAQLQTATKAFCACSTRFGEGPNRNVGPVCLALPGALPGFTGRALELAARAAVALHARIHEVSRFARKNYFYPDLPKGYQISMYELPLATGGWLETGKEGERKRIGITRLHLEEDAAKAMHEGFLESDRFTYIDFNRSGVPLVEIVSEPDMRTPGEAYAYLTTLKQILEYAEVSDCNMEEGSLRCDANVSVRRHGEEKFGTKAEVKNLNSFRNLQRALEYEMERQVGVIEAGGRVEQETRLWNAEEGRTEGMRSKELAHDYRYFPEPDLPVVRMEFAGKVREEMGELPDARRARYRAEYGLGEYDAEVLTATRDLGEYYEAVVKAGAPAKPAANWVITEVLRRVNEAGTELKQCRVKPGELAGLVKLVEAGRVTGQSGKKAFAQMMETGKSAEEIVAAEGLEQIEDEESIERACREAIERSPENAAKFRGGNENVLKYLVGQVMR